MRSDEDFLNDIIERIQLTEEFTTQGKEPFLRSRMMQEAVVRNLEVIGEAGRTVSQTLRDKYPEVPWKEIGAFRNFAIHVYWAVKMERIWQIVENDLPPLKNQIAKIIIESQSEDTN